MQTDDILEDISLSYMYPRATDYLHHLYTDNRTTFLQVYTRIQKELRYIHLLPLFASIRLYNNEIIDLLPVKQEIYRWIKESGFKDYFKKDFDLIKAVEKGQTPLSETVFRERGEHPMYVSSYTYMHLACLYNYSEEIKKCFDFLLLNALYNDNLHDYRDILQNLLTVQVQSYGKTTSQVIDYLLEEQLITPRMLFYTYASTIFWGDNVYLNSQAIEPYLKQNKTQAFNLLTELIGKEYEIAEKWIDAVYRIAGFNDYSYLIPFLNHESLKVKKLAEKILLNNDKAKEVVEKMIRLSDEPDSRLQAFIELWDDKKYENESFFKSDEDLIDFCNREVDKKKIKQLSWLPEKYWKSVCFKNGKRVPPVIIHYFLQCYLKLKEPRILHIGRRIAERIQSESLSGFLATLYQYWIKKEADSKYKMIILPYALYGGKEAIQILGQQVFVFQKSSRSAIATIIQKSVGLNGSAEAVEIVGYMAVYKEWAGAIQALEKIAEKRNIPLYALEDEIVPRLGFDQKGIKTINYPGFSLTLQLMPDFTITFIHNNKSFTTHTSFVPAPLKSRVKEDLSLLKKQIKEIIREQESRLIEVLLNGRKWEYEKWIGLFMNHPLLCFFTIKLIWGVYEQDKLKSIFIMNEKGEPASLTGELLSISPTSKITLVHPMESKEIQSWYKRQTIEPYIQNLFHILSLAVTPPLNQTEIENKKILRFNRVNVSQEVDLIKQIDNRYKNSVIFWDVYGIYFRDRHLDLEALLRTDFMHYTYKDTIIKDLRFYRYSFRKEHAYEQIVEKDLLDPQILPERFVTSVLMLCQDLVT